jgi:excisionase family DNA binding protein
MTKTEAAEFLQIGVRTLERYTSSGRLAAQRVKMARGFALDYDPAELQRFKVALDAEIEAQTQSAPHSPDGAQTATEVQKDNQLATVAINPATLATDGNNGAAIVAAIVAQTVKELEAQRLPGIETKLVLTIVECQQLTGFSRAFIRDAIEDKSLTARQIGKAWRIKRADLEKWVKAL